MQKEGRPCGPALLVFRLSGYALGRELADERRPVSNRCPGAGAASRAGTRAEQVVAGAAREERAAPGRVVARVPDVLAGNPDGVAVRRGSAVVAPARSRRIAAHLLLVAREAVVDCGTLAARNVVPRPDTGIGVDRRIG